MHLVPRLLSALTFLTAAASLPSCAPQDLETISVKTFRLANQDPSTTDDPYTRLEMQRRLRGAVSMEERRQRLGQYYTIHWNLPPGDQRPVRIRLEYRQASTASLVKHFEKTFPAAKSSGFTSFSVIGDDQLKNGRVLAWQASVFRGDTLIDSRRSYLWK